LSEKTLTFPVKNSKSFQDFWSFLFSKEGLVMNIEELEQEITDVVIKDAETFRKTQETAILVMMFIDMAKSTQTREEMGQVAFEILRRQKKQVLTSLIEREHKGKIVKDLGDGLLGVFALPDTALFTCIEQGSTENGFIINQSRRQEDEPFFKRLTRTHCGRV
jgi:class 3 adenylate cyclase